jgi:uncharacterized protein YrrD
MKEVMLGWSAKKQFLGKPLYNDKGEKVGSIDDVIIGPDKTSVSYVIVGAGGFAGLGKHDVAIPVGQLKYEGGKFLSGATKEVIKALPKFEYARAAAAQ